MGSAAAGRGHLTNLRPLSKRATRHRRRPLGRLENVAVLCLVSVDPSIRCATRPTTSTAVQMDEASVTPERERGVDPMRDAADPR